MVGGKVIGVVHRHDQWKRSVTRTERIVMLLVLILCVTFRSDDDLLVAHLGNEDFRVREVADAALRNRGWKARTALVRGMSSNDLEVRFRCGNLYDEALESVVSSIRDLPMIDALWYDEASGYAPYKEPGCQHYDRVKHYLQYSKDLGVPDTYLYEEYYRATRWMVRDLIVVGETPNTLGPMLDEMRRRDAIYYWRVFGLRGPSQYPPRIMVN